MKGAPPLSRRQAEERLLDIPGWTFGEAGTSIQREWVLKDFLAAVQLIQDIAVTAEREDHHPDLHLTGYRRLKAEISTHSIGGLSENDFILAAKIDRLPKSLKE